MVKTPDQLKNMMIDWCKEYHYECKELTKEELEKNPLLFGLIVGSSTKVLVLINGDAPNQIVFQMQITFGDSQQKETKNMEKSKWNDFLLKITDRLTSYSVTWTFEQEGQQFNKLFMQKFIDESVFSKDRFLQTMSRCHVIISQAVRAFNLILGLDEGTPTKTNTDKPMYG